MARRKQGRARGGTRRRTRRRPRGAPLPWDDDEALEQAAAVADQDLDRARVWWRVHAPARYADLLEAQPEDDALPLE